MQVTKKVSKKAETFYKGKVKEHMANHRVKPNNKSLFMLREMLVSTQRDLLIEKHELRLHTPTVELGLYEKNRVCFNFYIDGVYAFRLKAKKKVKKGNFHGNRT